MRRLYVFIMILFLIAVAVVLWWNNGIAAVNPQDKTSKIFIIQKGEGIREIASSLKKENLIKDTVVFFLIVKQKGYDGKIQAGDFRLSPSMNTEQIAQTLTHGTLDIWVTIPEGKRAEEIAGMLQKSIPSYKDSWRDVLNANEGYLFPDTYLIPKDAGVDLIVKLMKNNFIRRFSSIEKNPKNALADREIIILASMIEREAKFAQDRPLVASVMLNRLDLGMALQIDASIQYALGYQPQQKTWWKKHLSADDLKLNSSYNTYKSVGFPPTPISNPGLDVLQAAANPANTDYLYYISDSAGHNHYGKTLAEHDANIRKYGL